MCFGRFALPGGLATRQKRWQQTLTMRTNIIRFAYSVNRSTVQGYNSRILDQAYRKDQLRRNERQKLRVFAARQGSKPLSVNCSVMHLFVFATHLLPRYCLALR